MGERAEAVLALCGIGLLELGGGAEASAEAAGASEGDMLCMAAPLLMGLSSAAESF